MVAQYLLFDSHNYVTELTWVCLELHAILYASFPDKIEVLWPSHLLNNNRGRPVEI